MSSYGFPRRTHPTPQHPPRTGHDSSVPHQRRPTQRIDRPGGRHITPKLTLHTRECRKLNLTQSPNFAPIDPVYLNSSSAYTRQPPLSLSLLSGPSYHRPKIPHSAITPKPHRASTGFRNTAFPACSSFQGHPGLSRFEGHSPGPTASRRPPRPTTTHRDQVRRDGVTRSRQHLSKPQDLSAECSAMFVRCLFVIYLLRGHARPCYEKLCMQLVLGGNNAIIN